MYRRAHKHNSSRSVLLLLRERPVYCALDSVAQLDQRLVAEPPPRLGDVVVPRHAAVGDALAVEGGRLANDAKEDLTQQTEEQARFAGQGPRAAGPLVAAGGPPDSAGEVPKVDGLAVGDEEGLAVDALVVQGHRVAELGDEQGAGSQQVGVDHVFDVGEIEQVRVLADLHVVPALVVDVDQVIDGLDIAFAEDARGPNRGRQQLGRRLRAVGGQDNRLGLGLRGDGM